MEGTREEEKGSGQEGEKEVGKGYRDGGKQGRRERGK